MDIIISNAANQPIYEQIYNQIKTQIVSGKLKEDDLLPSIRNLAKDLRISVITTKRAYDELEKDGYLYSLAGKGFYVAEKNTEIIRETNMAMNGTLLNLRFPEEAVAGVAGRDNLVGFIDSYMNSGCMHVQFNIMSADKMKDAQKHPENYKDMLVRVAGYSAYFVELGKPLQDDLIDRTEFHF